MMGTVVDCVQQNHCLWDNQAFNNYQIFELNFNTNKKLPLPRLLIANLPCELGDSVFSLKLVGASCFKKLEVHVFNMDSKFFKHLLFFMT